MADQLGTDVDGGRENMPAAIPATDPADFPFGTVLRHPTTGRQAVRFQVDDTSGKGMHAWLAPATAADPTVRVLHHVEVRGWEPVELPAGVAEMMAAVLERQATEIADHWRAAEHDESANAELAKENISLRAEVERLRTSVIRAQTARAMEGTEAVKLEDKLLEADDEAGQLTHELAAVRASREAWAIEADRLDAELAAIRAKLAEVHDAAQYDDITTLRAVEMLAEQRDSFMAGWGRCHERHMRVEGKTSCPAIPTDAMYVESLKDDLALAGDEATAFRDLLSSIWLYVSWRSVTKRLTTEQKELWADAIEASGDPDEPTEVDRWWRAVAPVSGSDTTESGGDQ